MEMCSIVTEPMQLSQGLPPGPWCDFPETPGVGFSNSDSSVRKQKKEILLQNILGFSFSRVKMFTFNLIFLDLILK